jgi:hypothetical protein
MQKEASIGSYLKTLTDPVTVPVANYIWPPTDPGLSAIANQAIHRQMGHNIFAAGAGGLGAGILATRLHQILSQLNKPDEKYTKFAPGAQPVDDSEKIAVEQPGVMDQVAETVGRTVLSPLDPATARPGATKVEWSNQQKAFHTPIVLGTAAVGVTLGHQLMKRLYDKKKKEELNDTVQQAKKEYERALMGKRGSAELDRAFEKAALGSWLTGAASTAARTPFDMLFSVPLVREGYLTGLLGSTALAGKMTYDWTRERSRDKALERARRARARMAGTAPVYVDPEQLVAVKKLIEK